MEMRNNSNNHRILLLRACKLHVSYYAFSMKLFSDENLFQRMQRRIGMESKYN